jgi:MarR family transcriptional regulator, organic hydroperoxide resistance regulator
MSLFVVFIQNPFINSRDSSMKAQSRMQTAAEPSQARNEPQRARAGRRSRVREGGAVGEKGSAPRTAASIDQDRRVFDTTGRSIPWAIRDINRLFAATLEPLVSRDGVTVCHWYYLRILSEFDGLNQRELSHKVGVHPNTAVPALDNMEKHGLVKRVRDANDRRRMCVHLTPKGRRLRDEMIPDVSAMVFRSIANVPSADLDTFFKVIKRIEDNLVAEGGDIERAIEW